MKGLFITFEGIDGCGKSTHARALKDYLLEKGLDVVLTEEPGGTDLGQGIKQLLLNKKVYVTPVAELLLFAADRAQHVGVLIQPALSQGKCVISSRFADSTWVYQGVARNLDKELIRHLAQIATNNLQPDITFLLDLDPEKGLSRTQSTHKETAPRGEFDRIESEGIDFQKKVRAGYLQLTKEEPHRFVCLNTQEPKEKVQQKIRLKIDALLAQRVQ